MLESSNKSINVINKKDDKMNLNAAKEECEEEKISLEQIAEQLGEVEEKNESETDDRSNKLPCKDDASASSMNCISKEEEMQMEKDEWERMKIRHKDIKGMNEKENKQEIEKLVNQNVILMRRLVEADKKEEPLEKKIKQIEEKKIRRKKHARSINIREVTFRKR